ncbi:orotidine 5'-phosphate decarboxylase / HUMPS family protein [Mesorhizobium sp.]|nr:orotidine 5'-phosphate decarboxylase / HUMPS family protein [Mesorhizobium sp.]
MGPDTLQPFLACANQFGKGLFVLCRTSNPGATWLQDKKIGEHSVSDHLAELIGRLAEEYRHSSSLSSIGAVIGATVPKEGRRLRRMLAHSVILAPGLGAQGGDATAIHALRGGSPADLCFCVSRIDAHW